MNRRRVVMAAIIPLLFASLVWGQEPQYTLQTQSLERLADNARQMAQNCLPKDLAGAAERALGFLDPKLTPGIDAKRPFGGYATLSPAFIESAGTLVPEFKDSTVVLMIPMSSEKDLIELIGRTGIAPEKQADGSYSIVIPQLPFGVFLRAERGYMYVSVANEASLKKVLPAEQIFDAKETAILVVRQHHENFTKEAREAAAKSMKSVKDMLNNLQGQANLGVTEMAILNSYFALGARWNEMIDAGAKVSVTRLGADAKSGEFYAEWTIEPKAKSKLAEQLEAMKPTRNAFVGLTHDAVGHAVFRPPLDVPEIRDMLLGVTEKWKETLGPRNLPAEDEAAQLEMIKTLQRTIKSGDMDMAAAWRGPNAAGLYTVAGAIRIDDPKPAAKALRTLFDKARKVKGKWDAHKIGAMDVHELQPPLDAQAKKFFGDDARLLIGVGPNVVCAALGGDALALLKRIEEGKDGPAPLLSIEASGRRVAETLKKLDEYQENAILKDFVAVLGKMDRVPILGFQLEGGKQLKGRISLGVAGILMLVPREKRQSAPRDQ